MSVISVTSNNKNRKPIINETDEYQGLWINIGVLQAPAVEGDDPIFVRLPRGVAVSDLTPRKLYDNMSDDFAASANLMNQLIGEIQRKALTLAEGESVTINLEAQLYRRQEESEVSKTPEQNADLSKALFGGAGD